MNTAISQLYAEQIIKGNWSYDRVASPWIEEVKELLIKEGREDLIR